MVIDKKKIKINLKPIINKFKKIYIYLIVFETDVPTYSF